MLNQFNNILKRTKIEPVRVYYSHNAPPAIPENISQHTNSHQESYRSAAKMK